MLICDKCGCTVEESELLTYREANGEERTDYSCRCGGDLVEAKECPICGEWFIADEIGAVCDTCMKECETVGEALDMGERDKKSVDGINGFIAEVLSVDQINKILTKWVEENFTDHSKAVVDYCECDKDYFCDYLAEVYG